MQTKSAVLPVLILVIAGIAFYRLPTFGFLNIDDPIHVVRNPHLQHANFSGLIELWRRPYHSLYMPVTYTVWFLERVFLLAWHFE